MRQYCYSCLNKWLKKSIIFVCLWLILFKVAGYAYYYITLQEIRSGSLVCSRELGWINRRHAISDGPRQFMEKYLNKDLKVNDTITYAQFMGATILSKKIYIKIEKKYVVKKNIKQTDKGKALFCMFKDVSETFESVQGRIPFYFLNPSYSSSFANGDLTGNLISYYCANKHIDENYFIDQLSLRPLNDSLKQSLKTNHNFNKRWIAPSCKNEIVEFYLDHYNFNWRNNLKEIGPTLRIQDNTEY